MDERVDNVSHASLNGIYVKAQELDRGHNAEAAPEFMPPGSGIVQDSRSHASSHASDAHSHASDIESHASDASDAQTHASNADAESRATE